MEVVLFFVSCWLVSVAATLNIRVLPPRVEQRVTGTKGFLLPCDCGHQKEAPFWIIDGSSYELFTIPRYFPFIPLISSFSSLRVRKVPKSLNGSIFQCATFNKSGIMWGIGTKLILDGPMTSQRIGYHLKTLRSARLISDNSIHINYQVLDKEENDTVVGWTYGQGICNEFFQIQGYTLSHNSLLPSDNVWNASMEAIMTVPLKIKGDPAYYRVVAVEDGVVCSDMTSRITYYRFDESENRQTKVIAPNSSACFDIPETDHCTSPTFVLALSNGTDSALCPIHNSTVGWEAFRSCVKQLETDPIPYIFENGKVCLDPVMNETTLHFQCSTEPCINPCFVRTIISSYRIVLAGLPSEPNVTYDGTSLCFSAYTHEEFPVVGFTVEIVDITGTPYNPNITTASCIEISLDATPDICLPFDVKVTVNTSIGVSSSRNTFNTIPGQRARDCLCYGKKEQIDLIVEASTDSAVIMLSCAREKIEGPVTYLLEDKFIMISCGESQNITGLAPNTEYSLVRNYNNLVSCPINFYTRGIGITQENIASQSGSQDNSQGSSILAVTTILPVLVAGILAVVLIAIVPLVVVFITYLRRKRIYIPKISEVEL